MNRLRGIFIFGNTLLPMVIVFFLIVLFQTFGSELRESWRDTAANVDDVVQSGRNLRDRATVVADDVEKSLQNVQRATERLSETVKKPAQVISNSVGDIRKLNPKIVVPKVEVTQGSRILRTDLRIPKIKVSTQQIQIKIGAVLATPFAQVAQALNGLVAPLKELGKTGAILKDAFGTMRVDIENLQTASQNIQQGLQETNRALLNMLRWMFYFVVVLAIWFVGSYLFWFRARLARGMSLMIYGREPA